MVPRLLSAAFLALSCTYIFAAGEGPKAPGKMVDLGGHRLHLNCSGRGEPAVVVENGLGDFSFDWILVQRQVEKWTRICTYDRAGYAWSDPGPMPRTFAQLNLELRDALGKLGVRGPFVMVGHSFGGPVVRTFATSYPDMVAGMVLVDAAFEGQRVGIGGGRTIRLGESAKGIEIPPPHEEMQQSARQARQEARHDASSLDALYKMLPKDEQEMQLWAQSQPDLDAAEASQREWSEEYLARMLRTPQAGALREIPLIVLTRADGGYHDQAGLSAAEMERERREGQAAMARLSKSGRQIMVQSGHNMEIEVPDVVAAAIREVVNQVRRTSTH
jgi:pimeloyl-ACP methyl ester carboxylesterase